MTDPDGLVSRAVRRVESLVAARDRATAAEARVRELSRLLEAAVRALEAAAPLLPDPDWVERGHTGPSGGDLLVVAADIRATLRGERTAS